MQKKEKKNKSFWDSWTFLILFCIILPLGFRSLVYEPFHIPSGSMKSTLLVGDFIFVSKGSYGYSRYSFPFGLPIFKGRKNFEEPKRGDIIVFRPPPTPRTDYIKRLVGLPGDTIQMKGSRLYINGLELPKKQIEDFEEILPNGTIKKIPQFIQSLPNGVNFRILDETPRGNLDNTRAYKVPDGHYFLMGDNRDNSADSRTRQVGFVPAENLVGRADTVFISTKSSLLKFWRWFSDFRGERFWRSLEGAKAYE